MEYPNFYNLLNFNELMLFRKDVYYKSFYLTQVTHLAKILA